MTAASIAESRWRRATILRLALGAVFFAGVAWALHAIDLAALGRRLRHAAWPPLAVAAALQLVPLTVARALRWRALLPPEPRARVATLSLVLLASQALTNVLPLRPGEAYRTVALQRRGFPIDRVIASQAGEKLVEATSVAAFAVAVLATPALFHSARRVTLVALGLAALLVGCVAFVRGVGRHEGALGRVVARAVETLRSPAAWGKCLAFALVADVIDVAMIALSASSVGMPLSFLRCAAVLALVNLAIVIPAAPGQIGTLEAGAAGALVALGYDPNGALAFALLYHAVHALPATLVGGVILAATPRPRREPAETPS